MSARKTVSLKPPRWWKPALGGVAGMAWLTFVVLAVAPVVRTALTGQFELQQTGRRIAALDGWTGPRLLLEQELAENGPAVTEAWSRMFPAERNREVLFLDLARIADASGVEGFDLVEVTELALPDGPQYEDEDDFVPGLEPEAPRAAPVARAPRIALETYRIRASWTGDFHRTADFLARLRSIPRALSVSELAVQPDADGLRAVLELEVYVDGSTES